MCKDIKAIFKQFSELAEKEIEDISTIKKEQKATSKEIAEYHRIINKLKEYKEEKHIASLEDFQLIASFIAKMSNKQKINVEEIPAMPPGPIPLIPRLLKNASWKLVVAKIKFLKKSTAYYELVGVYFAGEKVDSKELWSLYDESMNLYNKYVELSNKEPESSKN